MRLTAWIFFGSLGAAAWACNETFPLELQSHPPSFVESDAGSDVAVAPVAKGARTLGVEVTVDALDFPQQVAAIKDAGARTTNVSFTWDDVETPTDAYEAGPGGNQIFNAGIHIVNLVLGSTDVRASFGIHAVDATGPRLPVDLVGLPLDDAKVETRYDVILDYAFDQLIDAKLDVYLVGVDVDLPLGSSAGQWAAFAGFVDHAAKHAHAKRADLKVGFVLSAAALVDKRDLVAAAIAASDVVVVSQPASFDALVDASPGGKMVFVHRLAPEAGVAETFGQWDRHIDRIPIVTFPALSDDLRREARARGF